MFLLAGTAKDLSNETNDGSVEDSELAGVMMIGNENSDGITKSYGEGMQAPVVMYTHVGIRGGAAEVVESLETCGEPAKTLLRT